MSGASGKVPAVIHVTPECAMEGPLAKVRTGDIILVDALAGHLIAKVDEKAWQQREVKTIDLTAHHYGMGRELFGNFRNNATAAEEGALSLELR